MKILKMLLEKSPDLNIKNKKRKTPLEITSNRAIISLLLQHLPKGEHKGFAEKPQDLSKRKSPAKLHTADKARHRSYQFAKPQEEDKELLPYGVKTV